MTSLGGRPHRAKHEAGWTLRRHPLGDCDWTSPAGLPYRTTPANYHWMRGQPPPDHEPDDDEPPDPADDEPPGRPDTGQQPDHPHPPAEPPDIAEPADSPNATDDPDPPPF